MRSVVASGRGLVAVGAFAEDSTCSGAAVWTPTDGLGWRRVPHQESLAGAGALVMRDVAVGESGLVAVGWSEVGDEFTAAA